jgi:hypothetical protein
MSNRRTTDIEPLTAIEIAAVRWADLGDLLGQTDDYCTTAARSISNQQDAARDFVLLNEATTATEAALQAKVLFAELDILDHSEPLDEDQQELYRQTMQRLAFAAESITRFLITSAGERYQRMAKNRSDLEYPCYRLAAERGRDK